MFWKWQSDLGRPSPSFALCFDQSRHQHMLKTSLPNYNKQGAQFLQSNFSSLASKLQLIVNEARVKLGGQKGKTVADAI